MRIPQKLRLSRGHADLASYETCKKIPYNQGIMTGPETEYGHDAIGDTVLRSPIKGYPTMGGYLPDVATMSSPRVRKGKVGI